MTKKFCNLSIIRLPSNRNRVLQRLVFYWDILF